MNEAIIAMIERRRPASQADWDRVLREVLQETALAGLWRAGFFDKAAFYGGTALRLFYRLDRFSEDLDFTLLEPEIVWKLSDRLSSLRSELEAFGFSVQIEPKHDGVIESAFIKANTKINLITIQAPTTTTEPIASNRLIKIKLEVDTDPPSGVKTENRILLEPFPFSVRVVVPSCLFSGKIHACLCRAWKSRVKGRDWYDFLFFISRDIPVNLAHLESRMRQSGHWSENRSLQGDDVLRLLIKRAQAIDWKQAREDALPFVSDARSLDLWGTQLFIEAAQRIKCNSPTAHP